MWSAKMGQYGLLKIKQAAELMDIEVPVSEGSEGVIQVFGYYTHKC